MQNTTRPGHSQNKFAALIRKGNGRVSLLLKLNLHIIILLLGILLISLILVIG